MLPYIAYMDPMGMKTILDQTSKNDPKPPRFRQTFHMQKHLRANQLKPTAIVYCGGIWTLWISHSGDSPWVAPNCSGCTHDTSYYTHVDVVLVCFISRFYSDPKCWPIKDTVTIAHYCLYICWQNITSIFATVSDIKIHQVHMFA